MNEGVKSVTRRMFAMLSAEPQCGSATAMKKENVHWAKLGQVGGKQRDVFLYTDVLIKHTKI